MSSSISIPLDRGEQALVFIALAIAGPFLLTWLLTSWRASRAVLLSTTTAAGLKRPPTMPYSMPIFGHLFQFIWNGHSLMSKASNKDISSTYVNRNVPTRIILPVFSNYVVSGPESVLAYFKESRDLSTTSRSLTILVNAFGCPNHLVDAFKPQQPPSINPGAQSEENIEQLIHRAVKTGLSGSYLDTLTTRFQGFFIEQIATDPLFASAGSWTEVSDLNTFVERRVFEAAIRSMFGTHMLSINPTLAEDFWNFNKSIGTLFMNLPRWMSPAAFRKRDKMLRSIEKWQRYAQEHCDIETIGDIDWEPYYGSKFIRERQGLLTKRGILDETARAAENFAFMWATNSNSVPAATWFLYEILQDVQLKSRISTILPSAALAPREDRYSSPIPIFDTPKLCSDPLLQSLYAETLRLRVAVLVVREPAKENYSFRGWHIKKDEVLSISTRNEAMNKEIWNTGGEGDPHPLDTMWADRFIVDPGDPSSGPLRVAKGRRQKPSIVVTKENGEPEPSKPYFSTDGLSTSWIPYGGGTSLCPGRHFAKQEILTTAAILLTAYELELVGQDCKGKPQVDMGCFGFGTMPPDRAIPFRIRRRRVWG
ncbi:MAG: hypothetical protein L6R41_004204 [Letrouitia leprolyta]|nr:MAG: hypothetical protein L6R41_004204 [Letrouitia leprolyta]